MNYLAAWPEIFLLGMIAAILLVDLFLKDNQRWMIYLLVQTTLIVAMVFIFARIWPQYHADFTPGVAFDGSYIVDRLSLLSKFFIYLYSFFAFAYARNYILVRGMARSEYYLLGLLAVLGMSVLVSAYSLLTLFLGLELLSLSLYAMVAMYKQSELAVEAAIKYFVLGGLASGMLLYGMSLIYGITGEIQIDAVARYFALHHDKIALIALIFMLAGILFKFGAVPFHMWVPDVYQGASTPMTLFIASAPKIAAFVLSVRILVQALPDLIGYWENILIVISILSMFFGNLLAIVQTSFKRMLAYSSIAHIGYTLLGILAGPQASQGYSAALFYIITYVLVAAGAFAIITLMSGDGEDLDQLDDYRGLNARHPWLAFMMLLLLFSMAGVPPTVGFFAKLGLLEALIEAHFVWLAVLALVFALIGAYYYLRVVMLMYFEEPQTNRERPLRLPLDAVTAVTINGLAALVLGLLPSPLIDLCRISLA